jgi:hypothetical protein
MGAATQEGEKEKQTNMSGSDPKAWVEIVRECNYLPEPDLKKLCEIVCPLRFFARDRTKNDFFFFFFFFFFRSSCQGA